GETVFTLVDRMTGQTRDELGVPVALNVETPKPVADVTTNSLDAYRHYVEGLDNNFKLYYADAAEDFRRAIEIDSTFAMAYFHYAMASTRTNNVAGALAAIQHAARFIDRVSEKERLYIEAMRAAFAFHQQDALTKLIEITKRYPGEKEAFFMLGTMYYATGDNEKAIEAYHGVLSLDPLHKPTYNQLAYAYESEGNFEKSIWAINQYIELSPGEANPYDTQGDLYAFNGDIDKAIDSYRKALEVKPDFIPSREKLGDMFIFKGRYEEATAQYTELTASDQPGVRSKGRLCLANIDIYRGRLRDGLKVLETGLAADEMEGFHGDAYLNKLGVRLGTYVELGECERAAGGVGDLSALLKKTFPMLAMVYDLVAAAGAAECGRPEVADSIFARVEPQVDSLDRNTLTAYHKTKGFVLLKGGDPGSAARHLEIADSLGPNQFSTRYYLAKAYLEAGRAEDAVSLLETALNRYDPSRLDDPLVAGKAVYLLGTAYEKVGAAGKAAEQYRSILDRWKNADPEVDEVSEARERLARLGAGG
ncbi:MAG: tetratricopeptide repeat protein, partial [bacterium]